jgi:hypothetical protein
MTHNSALCRSFVEYGKRLFAKHPELLHSWKIDDDEDHCILDIPKRADNGFGITVGVAADEISLFCEGFHEHYPLEGDPDTFANHYIGFLYDLLTPLMRLREHLAGESPYKWALECLEGDIWRPERTTGLLFFNYLGRRSERIYQNFSFPLRCEPLKKSTN